MLSKIKRISASALRRKTQEKVKYFSSFSPSPFRYVRSRFERKQVWLFRFRFRPRHDNGGGNLRPPSWLTFRFALRTSGQKRFFRVFRKRGNSRCCLLFPPTPRSHIRGRRGRGSKKGIDVWGWGGRKSLVNTPARGGEKKRKSEEGVEFLFISKCLGGGRGGCRGFC